ncbi:hypothetical protein J5J86_16565 [Aquabacter sp. L1I39]|uniref:hypothetical protein n=1 Tax=Aquabacter sp. L1I39 TaxID=2820278 RepID=UPI001ADD547D|nr:hypothetical protein [Aquabacter sp. L1I39]QTL02398.1 hypothetical protein J5J86_16565 [Aquabacter sp. L1I39]
MDDEAKWAFITARDDEMLKGGETMSEWCAFIVSDCDYAFLGRAPRNPYNRCRRN